jgi:hypothetical protein
MREQKIVEKKNVLIKTKTEILGKVQLRLEHQIMILFIVFAMFFHSCEYNKVA